MNKLFSAQLYESINNSGTPLLNLYNEDIFLTNLRFMYRVMLASEDILQEAINNSDGWLKDYFISHIEEERGHEKWLYDDLDGDVGGYNLIASACAGSQYYMIKHVTPFAFLGYIAVLEGYPMDLEIVAELEKIHGHKLNRCLRYHAENDIDHKEDLMKVLDKVPSEYHKIIIDNAVQTMQLIRFGLEN